MPRTLIIVSNTRAFSVPPEAPLSGGELLFDGKYLGRETAPEVQAALTAVMDAIVAAWTAAGWPVTDWRK